MVNDTFKTQGDTVMANINEQVERRITKNFENKLRAAIDEGAARAEKFAKDLEKDPAYALAWADSAYTAIGAQAVATILRDVLQAVGVVAARDYAVEQTLRGAKYPSRSTSACSNLIEQTKLAAYAEFGDWLNERLNDLDAEAEDAGPE